MTALAISIIITNIISFFIIMISLKNSSFDEQKLAGVLIKLYYSTLFALVYLLVNWLITKS